MTGGDGDPGASPSATSPIRSGVFEKYLPEIIQIAATITTPMAIAAPGNPSRPMAATHNGE